MAFPPARGNRGKAGTQGTIILGQKTLKIHGTSCQCREMSSWCSKHLNCLAPPSQLPRCLTSNPVSAALGFINREDAQPLEAFPWCIFKDLKPLLFFFFFTCLYKNLCVCRTCSGSTDLVYLYKNNRECLSLGARGPHSTPGKGK